ncbi:MAG: type II toxin-antitoxin system HipA family toxin [Atopobiaceae bacterium]|nr:type II toxin-antitoxin system HipA family toxin [Atopobiaceae bacterium]
MSHNFDHFLPKLTRIDVKYHGRHVGVLAQSSDSQACYFEYTDEWLHHGFSISSISLPLEKRVYKSSSSLPEGIFGVFRDSLPDDWGRLVVDRQLTAAGINPSQLSQLSRLSLVGDTGLGALEYFPSYQVYEEDARIDYDVLARECQSLMEMHDIEQLDVLFRYGRSSGGARPKVMVDIDDEPWIVKFPTRIDGMNSGLKEYHCALTARKCGIVMEEVRLLPSKECDGYFATKRFDRKSVGGLLSKMHMTSAAALLEASPFDVMDYRDLMKLSLTLTNSVSSSEQLFRVMCFNVFAGNCDDHSRNFSFIYDENTREWSLSPAYDLTIDDGFMGEHSTLVNGKGSDIELEDLVKVGMFGGISSRKCNEIVREIKSIVGQELGLAR